MRDEVVSYFGSQSAMGLQVHLTTMPSKNALGGRRGVNEVMDREVEGCIACRRVTVASSRMVGSRCQRQ